MMDDRGQYLSGLEFFSIGYKQSIIFLEILY